MEFMTGMVVQDYVTIRLPFVFVEVLHSIWKNLSNEKQEFGLYLRGSFNPETLEVTVEEDYYMPDQVTSPASIKFSEAPPDQTYNIVLHRHPAGCKHFSSVDSESINKEFMASILFIPPFDFPQAVVNIPIARGVKLQVPGAISLFSADADGALARIEKHVVKTILERPTLSLALRKQLSNSAEEFAEEFASKGSIHT